MKTVNVEIKPEEKASRIELFIRLVYWIPIVIVAFVLGIISGIAWLVNIFTILILGKRILALTKFSAMQVAYQAKANSYFMLVTDERPPIMPEEMN